MDFDFQSTKGQYQMITDNYVEKIQVDVSHGTNTNTY